MSEMYKPTKTENTGEVPRIIIAIPCYNEAEHIGDVVTTSKKYIEKVIVIDDGSTDKTAEIAESHGATVVKHKHNKGKGIAINTAFAVARDLNADIVILIDGDGQHDANFIPDLLKPVIEKQADVVVGSRFLKKYNRPPFYRTIGQNILTAVTNLGSGIHLTDCQTGFRAFNRKAYTALHFSERNLGAVESEMQFLFKENSLKITEVPITSIYEERAKRNPVIQGFGTLFRVIAVGGMRRPLLFITIPGIIVMLSGIILLLFSLNIRVDNVVKYIFITIWILMAVLGVSITSIGLAREKQRNNMLPTFKKG